jgi:hypothetical protein
MSKKCLILLVLILAMSLGSSKLLKENVVLAINCGGDEYTDENGINYQKDAYYDGGVNSDHGLNYDIANTKDMEVYQTERWHSDTLTYSLPLKQSGKYVLILKFSEVYFNMPNEKVFDIALGKKIIIKDLDIYAKVGKASAHDEFIEFEIKDDKVFVNKIEAPGAYDSKSKYLKLKFLKGSKDNPKINAIIVYHGDILDTDFAEKKRKLDEENRKKLQEAKKAYLIEKRHNPEEIYDEDSALYEDESVFVNEEISMLNIFFTIHGAYILISLGVFLVLNYFLEGLEKNSRSKIKID